MPTRTVKDMAPELLSQFHPFRASSTKFDLPARRGAAKETANALAKGLKERFNAARVVLFGSATRSDFSQSSDVDIAVWGVAASDYFKAVAYVSGYSSYFKVDLVDAEDCSASLLQHIEQNGVEL